MELQNSQAYVAHMAQKYGLTYHVPYAFRAVEEVGLANMDVLEVGGSLRREFVLQELKVNSWTGIESPEYELLSSKSNAQQGRDGWGDLQGIDVDCTGYREPRISPGSYSVCYADIEDLPDRHFGCYDRIFSIACFEHILQFPLALQKMYEALKPGGKLFSMFSPIWSSHNGHHLPRITDEQGNSYFFNSSPIPPWGHLTMRPAEMEKYLRNIMDHETACRIVFSVYTSPHINRFFTEDYVQFVGQSSFVAIKMEATFPARITPDVQSSLEHLFPGRRHFANNGLLFVLEKPA